VFSNLIELREGVSSGHSRRVADLARKIAIKLNFPATEAQDVMLAGLLHDVGKIGLPDELLSKPVSHMSGDELGLLRKHPVTGQAALMGLENLRKAGSFIRGTTSAGMVKVTRTGYPVWPSPMARVLAVANDFDALQIGTLRHAS
jgi:response regulator RpfG family c-di-GMP phosphodiesterase